LDETKADKRDLEALRKFIQNSLQQSGGNIDFKGMDDLTEIMKRLDDLEHKVQTCMTLNDKKDITTSLEELWRAVKDVTNVKLPQLNADIAENSSGLKNVNEETKRLDTHKLDKRVFDEYVKFITDTLNTLKGVKTNDSSDDLKKI